jgi:MFS family permease
METDFKRYRPLTYEGVAASVMSSITARFLPLLALYLGANNAAIGAVVSVPAAVALVGYLPAAMAVEKMKRVKGFCALTSFLSRAVWFLVAFLPFLPFLEDRMLGLMILVSVSSLTGAFINPAWATLVGNLIPGSVRGRYFGMRDRLSGIFSLVTVFGAGFVLDLLGNGNGFFVLFLIAGIAGVLTTVFFTRVSEVPNQTMEGAGVVRELRKALRNRVMRRFMLSLLVWQFGVYVAAPFFNVYLVEEMNAPYWWVSTLLLASGVGGIIMYKAWGGFSDRFGPRMAIIFSAFGACSVPILWFFSGSLNELIMIEFMSGVVWAGLNMAYFTYMFEISREGRRSIYSSLFMTVLGVPVVVAPLVGGFIADSVALPIMGGVTGIRAAMFVSFWIRFVGFMLFVKFLMDVPPRDKVSVKYITHEILNLGRYHATVPFILVGRNGMQLAKYYFNSLKSGLADIKHAGVWKRLPKAARSEITKIEREVATLENEIKVIEFREEKRIAKVLRTVAKNGRKLSKIVVPVKRIGRGK